MLGDSRNAPTNLLYSFNQNSLVERGRKALRPYTSNKLSFFTSPYLLPLLNFPPEQPIMDAATLKEKITAIESQRDSLLNILEQPDLGILRIDVNQALEELDDLIDEFHRTFPEERK